MSKRGLLELCVGLALVVSACGRTELSGWLLGGTGAAPPAAAAGGTTASASEQTTTVGATATVAGETTGASSLVSGAGGITGSSVTMGAGGSLSPGGAPSAGGEGGAAPSELEIEPDALPPGRYKLDYDARFSASGGSGTYTFQLTDGELPPGLELASDGRITGIPSFPGTWSFVVEVSDDLGARTEQQYELEIERNSLLAVSVFLSSSSTRTDSMLLDLTAPGDGLLHRLDWSRFPRFAPDGRWLTWTTFEGADTSDWYATSLIDTTPLVQVPLADDLTDDAWCLWSPDSTNLACTTQDGDGSNVRLGVRSVTATSLGPETLIETAEGYFQWLGATRLAYYDAASELFVADIDHDVVTTRVFLPSLRAEVGPLLLYADYGTERALVQDSEGNHTYVVDLATEAWLELPAYEFRSYAPELDFVLGWDGANRFLHGLDGTALLGPLDVSGAGDLSTSGTFTFAPRSPRFAALAEGRVIVSTLVAGALDNIAIGGEYAAPIPYGLTFSPDARWLAISTDTELWLCDIDGSGPFAAVKLGDVARATVSFAPDSSALAYVGEGSNNPDGGTPVTLATVDLTNPPELATRVLETDDEWGSPGWSNDASYLVFLGASVTTRALHVYDLLEPESAPRLVVACSDPLGSEPSCPNAVEFQPWVPWL